MDKNSETSSEAQIGAPGTVDLSAAGFTETAVIDICFPGTSKPTGWKIMLAGPAHAKTIAVSDDIGRENIDKEKAMEFAQVNGRKWKVDGETVTDRRRKNIGRVVARILSWSPDPVFKETGPAGIAFSHEAAVDLFMRPDKGWAFNQIAEYINSEKAFTLASANN